MRTRIVRVRRARGFRYGLWFLLMMCALCAFTSLGLPTLRKNASILIEMPAPTPQSTQRITQEMGFERIDLHLIALTARTHEEEARYEAAKYAARGGAGYVYAQDGAFYPILAGYANIADAERVCAQLQQSEQMDCAILCLVEEAVVLRVTATNMQIDALFQAQACLRDVADALNARAFSLDTGHMGEGEIHAFLREACARTEDAYARLSACAGDPPNSVAAALLESLRTLGDAISMLFLETDETGLFFSGKMKYTSIDTRVRLLQFLRALAT